MLSMLLDLVEATARLVALGGWVVAVQLAVSVVGLAIVLYKFLQFSRLSDARFDELTAAIERWSRGAVDDARAALAASPLALAADVGYGLERTATAQPDRLHDELLRRGQRFVQPYAGLLRTIELVYYLSPVLGLLGTVLGMIDAFRELAAVAGGGEHSNALAAGIWKALLTTAVGLVVAVPFTVFHAMLETRYERIAERTADVLLRVTTVRLD
jgi:biopolymer transport protein ExbB